MSTAHGANAHSAGGVATGDYTGYLIKLTVISTLGGLLFCYDTGVISGALPFLTEDLSLSSVQEATVVSSLLFGAMIGALIGGKLSDVLGRKGGLRFCAILSS
jgi:MFS transporter, SP family, major inositol transporter